MLKKLKILKIEFKKIYIKLIYKMNKCNVCNIKLRNISLDSNIFFYDDYWNESFRKYIYSFSVYNKNLIKNIYYCINCGIDYSFNLNKDKYKLLKHKEITGKIIKKFPLYRNNREFIYEICSKCNCTLNNKINDTIITRDNYICGIGSFCSDCYYQLFIY